MYTNRAHDVYQKMQVQTANPTGLIILLYRGAIDRLIAAERQLRSDDKERMNASLKAAQDIILELMVSVDTSADDEFALGLLRLYEYAYHRLVRANVENDSGMIEEVKGILEQLLEAWRLVMADSSEYSSRDEQPVDLTV